MSAFLLGRLAGGVLVVFILQQLLEWAIFKRVVDDPLTGKLLSTISAYLLAAMIGAASMGVFGLILYLPGALIVGFFAIRKGIKLRAGMNEEGPSTAFE